MPKIEKSVLKARMTQLEQDELDHAIEHYEAFLADAKVDAREAHSQDDYATARQNADLADAFDHPIHDHRAKLELIEALDFGPKTQAEPGAVVGWAGRHFVVSTSTRRFSCDGLEFMGISQDAPVYKAIKGLSAGDEFTLNGRCMVLDEVY